MVQFLGSSEGRHHRPSVSASRLARCLNCLQVVKRDEGHLIKCKGTNLLVGVDGTVRPKHEWWDIWGIFIYLTIKWWVGIHNSTWATLFLIWKLNFGAGEKFSGDCGGCVTISIALNVTENFRLTEMWGSVKFWMMTVCKVTQLEMCHFHPYDPVYPKIQFRNSPEGEYPCCGARAFRFSLIEAGTVSHSLLTWSCCPVRCVRAVTCLTTPWPSGRWRTGRFTTSWWPTGKSSASRPKEKIIFSSPNSFQSSRTWWVRTLVLACDEGNVNSRTQCRDQSQKTELNQTIRGRLETQNRSGTFSVPTYPGKY